LPCNVGPVGLHETNSLEANYGTNLLIAFSKFNLTCSSGTTSKNQGRAAVGRHHA
jgi:hypothetical protein